MDRRVFRFLAPYWRRLAGVLAVSLVSTALSLWLPYLSKAFVDSALVGRDRGVLTTTVLLFGGLAVVSFLLSVVSGLWYTRVSAAILFDMRRALYEHLQRLSPRFYASTRLGDLLSRINNDIGEIQRVAAESALAWVGNGLFLLGGVAMLVWLDARLFAIGLAALPPSAVALAWYRRRLEARTTVLRVRSADLGSFLIETVQGMRAVVTSSAEGREVRRFSRLNDAFVATLMGVQRVHYWAGGLPALFIGAGTLAVLLYGGTRVVEGTLTLGTLAAFLAYQARVVAPMQALLGLVGALATAGVSWRRVAELLDTPVDVTERPGARPLEVASGDLAFDGVTLSYGRAGAVLDDVTFRARPGETVAIVGASGAGKSTVADLAVRLLDPDRGVVRLDGHDVRDLRIADVRRHVRVVEQDPVLFHTTLDENLRYARPDASSDEVRAAVASVGLRAFVDALPDGLGTVVGDRGLALSAGERQRVAVARVLLARPAVLVLDEPSAALDPAHERQLIDGYAAAMRGRTTIVITHRLDVVRRADRVVVLSGSKVVETGTPAALEAARGAFAALFGLPSRTR